LALLRLGIKVIFPGFISGRKETQGKPTCPKDNFANKQMQVCLGATQDKMEVLEERGL
jgi:hypothetical protein